MCRNEKLLVRRIGCPECRAGTQQYAGGRLMVGALLECFEAGGRRSLYLRRIHQPYRTVAKSLYGW